LKSLDDPDSLTFALERSELPVLYENSWHPEVISQPNCEAQVVRAAVEFSCGTAYNNIQAVRPGMGWKLPWNLLPRVGWSCGRPRQSEH